MSLEKGCTEPGVHRTKGLLLAPAHSHISSVVTLDLLALGAFVGSGDMGLCTASLTLADPLQPRASPLFF